MPDVYFLHRLRHQKFLLYLFHFLLIFQQICLLYHLHNVCILKDSVPSEASEVLYFLPFSLFPAIFPMDPHLKI